MLHCDGNKIFIDEELYYIVYRRNKRIIFSPCKELKYKQRYFLNAIRWAFPIDMDTLKCAKPHINKKWILKLDIKNFYDSIPYCKIKKIVELVCKTMENANVNYYLNLVTVNKTLPTGALTSSHIANNCFNEIDIVIKDYCNMFGVSYSRYMDDLTFSSNNKRILNRIETHVKEILTSHNYKLNNKKTKYISSNKQQNVLGLVLNDGKVRLDKKKKRAIRAMLHSYIVNKSSREKELKYCTWDEKQEQKLKGHLAYIKHVDNEYFQQLVSYANKLIRKYNADISFF